MHLSHPLRTLAPTLDMGVLGCVARSTRVYSLGDIVAHTGASRPGVRLAAGRLATGGLLETVQLGRATGYRFNRDHLLAEPVLAAIQARATLQSRIRDHITAWELPARRVILFGSVARDVADAESDVDLIVISESPKALTEDAWQEQVLDLVTAVRRWTGNECDVISFTEQEWSDARSRDEALPAEIGRDGIVLLDTRSESHRTNKAPA